MGYFYRQMFQEKLMLAVLLKDILPSKVQGHKQHIPHFPSCHHKQYIIILLLQQGDNVLGSVHPSLCSLLSLLNRLTYDIDICYVGRPRHWPGWDCRSRSKVKVNFRRTSLSAAKSNNIHYQSKVFVCVFVIRSVRCADNSAHNISYQIKDVISISWEWHIM